MELCLYDPAAGYYSSHAEQFGKAGDFYTSSDVHAVFGRLLARQFEEMWQALDRPSQIEIVELGPGRGLFARDVLDWSKKKFPDFFDALTFTLQESSATLLAKLQDTLREHMATGKAGVVEDRHSEGQPDGLRCALAPEVPLIVFANEFFDALPIDILGTQGKLHLAIENNHLREIWLPPQAEELEFLDRYGVHPEANERIEVPLAAQRWMQQTCAEQFTDEKADAARGLVLPAGESLSGRLMAYRHHSASPDPYQAPGEQDLTAHVNFTALIAACEPAGMRCESLRTQSQFLMGIGEKTQFADAFEDCRLPQELAKVALQLKHLVTPIGMGENFRVLMASRGMDPGKVTALSGLSFGSGSE